MSLPSDTAPVTAKASSARSTQADGVVADTTATVSDSTQIGVRDTSNLPALHGIAPWTLRCRETDAPWSARDRAMTHQTSSEAYKSGLQGTSRPVGYGENSWLSTIILCLLILLSLNFRNCSRIFASLPQDLFGIRRRQNAFDEHTANETRTYLIILLLLCLSEGILIFSGITSGIGVPDGLTPFALTMMCAGAAALFYVAQLAVYKVIGYAFTDTISSAQWIRGFNASQCVLSFLLLIPALIALFYPDEAREMVMTGLICYILARILFICKGFRIFYKNFPSILYFILYLCALEITPLVFIARLVASMAADELKF